jgi:hypothetical protein
VLQAPVPLQQPPEYLPQAPLAPAHMNNISTWRCYFINIL